jgi:hypothetical protein
MRSLSEADILSKVVAPNKANLNAEAAHAFLAFRFDAATNRRIQLLLEKNNRGTISAPESLRLEKYLRVGQFLDLLHAKAKLSLKNNADSHTALQSAYGQG